MKSATQTTIYLALGTNLGDRAANVRAAVHMLAPEIQVERMSSLYETEPAYVTDQPRFLNAALRATTGLDPHLLLAKLKRVERDLGRVATVRNGPRLIDLDVLLYGDLTLCIEQLVVPHPRIAERPFVLVPLAEIAPDLLIPGYAETVSALAERVHGNGDVLARVGPIDEKLFE